MKLYEYLITYEIKVETDNVSGIYQEKEIQKGVDANDAWARLLEEKDEEIKLVDIKRII